MSATPQTDIGLVPLLVVGDGFEAASDAGVEVDLQTDSDGDVQPDSNDEGVAPAAGPETEVNVDSIGRVHLDPDVVADWVAAAEASRSSSSRHPEIRAAGAARPAAAAAASQAAASTSPSLNPEIREKGAVYLGEQHLGRVSVVNSGSSCRMFVY